MRLQSSPEKNGKKKIIKHLICKIQRPLLVSFHLSFFVFRQFWGRSYQNQLSFSGRDSTADFFCQNDKKQKAKDEMNPALL